MKASEEIRETRLWLFENGWSNAAPQANPEGGCVLAALAAVKGDYKHNWARYARCDAAVAIHAAIGQLHPDFIAEYGEAFDWLVPGDYVYRFNDRYGRTFDQIVEVLDRAEKIAEQAEANAR